MERVERGQDRDGGGERSSDRGGFSPGGDGGGRGEGGGGRGGFRRRKVCRFCSEKDAVIDYRDVNSLRFYISERGKVVPRRISGNCAKHQRKMAVALKRGRAIALIPFAITG